MEIKRHSHAKYIVAIVLLCIITVFGMVAFAGQSNLKAAAESALATTQSELTDTQSNLTTTEAKLTTKDAELTQTRADLTETENDLTTTETKLAATSADLTTTKTKLTTAEAGYAAAKAQLATATEESAALEEELAALQVNYDRTVAGYDYVLKDPTYKELKSFIAADKTDANQYIVNVYVCHDFAADVKANAASQKKFRCAYVYMDFNDSAHAIVAFNTTDKGIIYIEPQSDEEVNLQVGWHYWTQCVIPKAGTYYNASNYDDTVQSFNDIW